MIDDIRTQFIQAVGNEDSATVEHLLRYTPACRALITPAIKRICLGGNHDSACFQLLKQEATQETLNETETALKQLSHEFKQHRGVREAAEKWTRLIREETARRLLKKPTIEL